MTGYWVGCTDELDAKLRMWKLILWMWSVTGVLMID